MRGRVKKKDHERLDDSTIVRVINLLNAEQPITKKTACEILNISYNTTRLNRIIEEYKSDSEFRAKRRAKNRGKPIVEGELKYVVTEYLKGENISKIAESIYHSPNKIRQTLVDNYVPFRESGVTYQRPALVPDENLKKEYEAGELVWSARYNCMAEIIKLVQVTKEDGNVYAIWIFGKHNEFGNQPWYELGSLPVLDKLGITKDDIKVSDELNLSYG
jgi:hypothetical protein